MTKTELILRFLSSPTTVQATIATVVLVGYVYRLTTYGDVPPGLTSLTIMCVSFYFGAHTQAMFNGSINKDNKQNDNTV